MNNKIKALLSDGETILWQGSPKEFETFDTEYKEKFKTSFLILGIVGLIVEFSYIFFTIKSGAAVNFLYALAILIVFLAFPVIEITEASRIRKLSYVFTDQKIIIDGINSKVCPYNLIKDFKLVTDKAGTKSLVCGNKIDLSSKDTNLRMASMLCLDSKQKDKALADALVLYSLPDETLGIINQYVSC